VNAPRPLVDLLPRQGALSQWIARASLDELRDAYAFAQEVEATHERIGAGLPYAAHFDCIGMRGALVAFAADSAYAACLRSFANIDGPARLLRDMHVADAIHAQRAAVGRAWTDADSFALTSFPDCHRVECYWNDGALQYALHDTRGEALAHLLDLGADVPHSRRVDELRARLQQAERCRQHAAACELRQAIADALDEVQS
jgi:hypothetical protein